jgi:hypothetical protein
MPICISIVLKLLNSLHDINMNAMYTGRSIVTTGIVAFLLLLRCDGARPLDYS